MMASSVHCPGIASVLPHRSREVFARLHGSSGEQVKLVVIILNPKRVKGYAAFPKAAR
jgi:hypothetical protein